MFVNDFVMRQIRKIAELAAAIAAGRSGPTMENVDEELAEAYRSLLGMDEPMAATLSADSLARLLGDADQIGALALLLRAHGDLSASRNETSAARRRWEKALTLTMEIGGDALKAELEERLRAQS